MRAFHVLTSCAALLVSCGEKQKSTESDRGDRKPTIAAVNYPLAYFADRLAGDFATIVFEVPPDEDPAFWKPTDEQIARIQQADLILLNGASYAKWVATASLPPNSRVVTSESFETTYLKAEGVTHAHGKKAEDHSHGGFAFTTWLDLKQAAAQAAAAANAIAREFPDHKEVVMDNLAMLLSDLKDLDRVMASATAMLKGAPVIASHPVYQYWERAYGLVVPSLLWEPEMDLTEEAMADLRKIQDAHPGAAIFIWEGEPLPAHIEKLRSVGLTSVVVSPCANRPSSGDFLSVIKRGITSLQALAE